MDIAPDTKDWTWVLNQQCEQCGLNVSGIEPTAIPAMIRDNPSRWEAVLRGESVVTRPSPMVRSPLEYACHVRDVFRLFERRLDLMLTKSVPIFPNWDQDQTAVAERYGAQDPLTVLRELQAAAGEPCWSPRRCQWRRLEAWRNSR